MTLRNNTNTNLTDALVIRPHNDSEDKEIKESENIEMNSIAEVKEDFPVTGSVDRGDPWKHRSKGMVCETCMWFIVKGEDSKLGRCRKHAPTISGYPAVFLGDWCGDHKLDETKIR